MMLPPTPEERSPTVATPTSGVPGCCPVCKKVLLTGKKTVCSPKCRIQRSMAKRAAKRADWNATARLHLRAAQQAVADTQRHIAEVLEILEEPP